MYAFAKTGNPVFPFANQVFRAPDFDTTKSFSDPRFTNTLSWKTPYEITFRSTKFMEAQGGAGGFQYFLLLIPAMLLARRRDQWIILTIAAVASGIILLVLPNLRYLYPALPLASLAIAWLVAEAPATVGTPGLLSLIALNVWFLPSSGWYHNDFALFRHAEIQPYLERMAPVRLLIDDLNHRAPGEPVAFFSIEETGGLNGPAYTDTWHSERYWNRVRHARNARDVAVIFNELGIHYVIAPASGKVNSPTVERFLRRQLEPIRPPLGSLGLFRITEVLPQDMSPLAPGRYDDLEERVSFSGSWQPDFQFPETSGQSLTYSDAPGESFRITFTGSALTYVYTEAANRGIAEITIDGGSNVRVDQYSRTTHWQTARRFAGLQAGVHTLEVRVSGEKDPQSNGLFVDLDAFVVEP